MPRQRFRSFSASSRTAQPKQAAAENMEAALREVWLAMPEAGVNFRVVKQLIDAVEES